MSKQTLETLPILLRRSILFSSIFTLTLALYLVAIPGHLGLQLAVAKDDAKGEAKDEEEAEPEPPPEPIDETLDTPDNVRLSFRFYGGTKGKDTVPIIIIHDWEESGEDYYDLAELLQLEGHAVVVPDLRGHGDSLEKVEKLANGERTKILNVDRFKKKDLEDIYKYDLDTIKNFLMVQHNDHKLNIEKLGLIGVGRGALLALYYSQHDHSWPELVGLKNGHDVRALVLVSPHLNAPGLKADVPLAHNVIKNDLAMLILVGENDKRPLSNAKRINGRLKKYRKIPPGSAKARRDKLTTLFFQPLPTNLQGLQLLDLDDEDVDAKPLITAFIELRLTDQKIPHKIRKRP